MISLQNGDTSLQLLGYCGKYYYCGRESSASPNGFEYWF